FSREQQLIERRRHTALEHHRLAGLSDSAQQRKVLHVASADLHHVGELFNEIGGFRIENLCDDAKPESLAHVSKNLQSVFAQALERVRRSSGLECAAAKQL